MRDGTTVAEDVGWDGNKALQHSDSVDKSPDFHCEPKRANITIRKCLEDFTDAHAHKKKSKNKCWRCPLGAANRVRFGFGLEPTPRRIEAILAISSRPAIQPWMWLALGIGNVD